jgi:hypothetical protein
MDIDILQCSVVEDLRSDISTVGTLLLTFHTRSLLLPLLLVVRLLSWSFLLSAKLDLLLPLSPLMQRLQTRPIRTRVSSATFAPEDSTAYGLRRGFHLSPTPPIHEGVKLLPELVLQHHW